MWNPGAYWLVQAGASCDWLVQNCASCDWLVQNWLTQLSAEDYSKNSFQTLHFVQNVRKMICAKIHIIEKSKKKNHYYVLHIVCLPPINHNFTKFANIKYVKKLKNISTLNKIKNKSIFLQFIIPYHSRTRSWKWVGRRSRGWRGRAGSWNTRSRPSSRGEPNSGTNSLIL